MYHEGRVARRLISLRLCQEPRAGHRAGHIPVRTRRRNRAWGAGKVSALKRWRAGEREAFLQVVAEYAMAALVVARALRGAGKPSEELVRQAFRRLLEEGPGALGEDPDESAVLAYVRAFALGHGKRASPGAGPGIAGIDADEAYESLLALPGIERELLFLTYAQGLPLVEAAAELSLDLADARAQLRLALRHIRDGVEERAGAQPA